MENQLTNSKELGTALREARKAQGLTQEDLAGITGTGRRFIVELESGKETAQIGKVIKVLKAVGLSLTASRKWK